MRCASFRCITDVLRCITFCNVTLCFHSLCWLCPMSLRCAAMRHDAPRCAAMRRDAPRCAAMCRDAPRCAAMRCDALRCAAVRCDKMQCDALRCDAVAEVAQRNLRLYLLVHILLLLILVRRHGFVLFRVALDRIDSSSAKNGNISHIFFPVCWLSSGVCASLFGKFICLTAERECPVAKRASLC
jgi:hypothetical protein